MATTRTKKKVVLLFLCPENAGKYKIKPYNTELSKHIN